DPVEFAVPLLTATDKAPPPHAAAISPIVTLTMLLPDRFCCTENPSPSQRETTAPFAPSDVELAERLVAYPTTITSVVTDRIPRTVKTAMRVRHVCAQGRRDGIGLTGDGDVYARDVRRVHA